MMMEDEPTVPRFGWPLIPISRQLSKEVAYCICPEEEDYFYIILSFTAPYLFKI